KESCHLDLNMCSTQREGNYAAANLVDRNSVATLGHDERSRHPSGSVRRNKARSSRSAERWSADLLGPGPSTERERIGSLPHSPPHGQPKRISGNLPSNIRKHWTFSLSLHGCARFGSLHSYFQGERVPFRTVRGNSVQHRDWTPGQSQAVWDGSLRILKDRSRN